MKGSCLCGKVTYQIDPPFKIFQYCHCTRCQKFTGSAHAANLFVPPDQFRWLTGEDQLTRFEQPDAKYFATGFCKVCGSSMPWAVKGGKNIVVPAGTLDETPPLKPMHNIYWDSRAPWYEETCHMKKYAELPTKS